MFINVLKGHKAQMKKGARIANHGNSLKIKEQKKIAKTKDKCA